MLLLLTTHPGLLQHFDAAPQTVQFAGQGTCGVLGEGATGGVMRKVRETKLLEKISVGTPAKEPVVTVGEDGTADNNQSVGDEEAVEAMTWEKRRRTRRRSTERGRGRCGSDMVVAKVVVWINNVYYYYGVKSMTRDALTSANENNTHV